MCRKGWRTLFQVLSPLLRNSLSRSYNYSRNHWRGSNYTREKGRSFWAIWRRGMAMIRRRSSPATSASSATVINIAARAKAENYAISAIAKSRSMARRPGGAWASERSLWTVRQRIPIFCLRLRAELLLRRGSSWMRRGMTSPMIFISKAKTWLKSVSWAARRASESWHRTETTAPVASK